jgi:hypothetical protein
VYQLRFRPSRVQLTTFRSFCFFHSQETKQCHTSLISGSWAEFVGEFRLFVGEPPPESEQQNLLTMAVGCRWPGSVVLSSIGAIRFAQG